MDETKTVDAHWARMPGVTKFNPRTRKREFMTTFPKILRDLSALSFSSFNPNEVWEREKEKEEMEQKLEQKQAEEKEKEAKGKKLKKAEANKMEIIEAKNLTRKADNSFNKDIERIRNKKAENGLHTIIRDVTTPRGRLVLYIEILALAISSLDKKLAYDVFWAIESSEIYQQNKLEFDIPKPESKRFPGLVYDNKAAIKRCIDKILEWRAEEDMIVKQLTDMSDCLPPLSKFLTDFRLDPWQKRVLRWIDANKSVVICAPTSSGKTILSTYVAFMGRARLLAGQEAKVSAPVPSPDGDFEDEDEMMSNNPVAASEKQKDVQRVLFVVPTEPLAWQVCAHFTRMFRENGMGATTVAVVSNQVTYTPQVRADEPPHVVVGTPLALESAIMKIRGKVSWAERPKHLGGEGLVDRSILPGGFHHYKWVVYDEVHTLNGEEGDALQRLIKLLNCNFLALSATVGNAEQLRSWMEQVRGQQLNVEVVSAPKEAWAASTDVEVEVAEEPRLVKLQEHHGRFINLQRHVWNAATPKTVVESEGGGGGAGTTGVSFAPTETTTSTTITEQEFELQPLHPLAAVETVSQLQRGIFRYTSLPMTPTDSYRLWARISESKTESGEPLFPREVIADADPHNFFSGTERITLQRTKEYEDYLKQVLEDLSNEFPEQTQRLLDGFHITEPPKTFDLCDLIMNLRDKQMLPALVFHLNIFDLVKLYKQLVGGLEWRQKNKYPTYYHSLITRQKQSDAELESAFTGMKTDKEKEEAMRFGDGPTERQVIDLTMPHPEFVLSKKQLTEKEFSDICDDIKREDRFDGVVSQHALLRGLRRGVGLYIDEPSFPAYRRAVMRLSTKGALAVVLSDSSLAFGVNMPFRTCVFSGEMKGLLDPLMAQQMSGRAGRRGLDEQGHIVFAASHSAFIRNIMLGQVPAISGGKNRPRSEVQFIQTMVSWHMCPSSFPHQIEVLDSPALDEYCSNKVLTNFNERSRDILLGLRMIQPCNVISKMKMEEIGQTDDTDLVNFYKNVSGAGTPSGYIPDSNRANVATLWMMWELRGNAAESFALGRMMPFIYDEFVKNNRRIYGANEKLPDVVLFQFFAILLHIIDRTPCKEGDVPLHMHPYIQQNLNDWEEWEDRLQRYTRELKAIPNTENLILPVPIGHNLDSTFFDSVMYCDRVHSLPSDIKQDIKKRIWNIGNVLRIMHNTTYPDTEKYMKIELITRTCFTRLNYLARELIQNEINFNEVCSYETEGRNDTSVPPTPEVVPWGDAEEEPHTLDPFAASATAAPIKKNVRVKAATKAAADAAAAIALATSTSDSVMTTTAEKTVTTTTTAEKSETPGPVSATATTSAAPEVSAAEAQLAEAIKEAKKMKPDKLKDALKSRGLSTQGNKNELLSRMLDAIKKEFS